MLLAWGPHSENYLPGGDCCVLIVVLCSSLVTIYVMSLLNVPVDGATHTTTKLPLTAVVRRGNISVLLL